MECVMENIKEDTKKLRQDINDLIKNFHEKYDDYYISDIVYHKDLASFSDGYVYAIGNVEPKVMLKPQNYA